jgi:hypothetical protein
MRTIFSNLDTARGVIVVLSDGKHPGDTAAVEVIGVALDKLRAGSRVARSTTPIGIGFQKKFSRYSPVFPAG